MILGTNRIPKIMIIKKRPTYLRLGI